MKLSLHGWGGGGGGRGLAPGHGGAIATMLITDSHADVGVHCPNVLLDFISPCARDHR
jgi:hypothetical protein